MSITCQCNVHTVQEQVLAIQHKEGSLPEKFAKHYLLKSKPDVIYVATYDPDRTNGIMNLISYDSCSLTIATISVTVSSTALQLPDLQKIDYTPRSTSSKRNVWFENHRCLAPWVLKI